MSEKSKNVLTPDFRVSFPNVFKPSAMKGGEPKYSITMLIPKKLEGVQLERFQAIKALLKAVVTAAYPDGKLPPKFRNPLRDGDTDETYSVRPECKDMWVVAARNPTKPNVVDANVQPIINEGEFYGGCYARASLTAFCYNQNGNRGVALSLQNVQKLRDGEPFSGRARAEDDFGPVEGAAGGVSREEGDGAGMFD